MDMLPYKKEEGWQLQKALLFKTERFYIPHTIQMHWKKWNVHNPCQIFKICVRLPVPLRRIFYKMSFPFLFWMILINSLVKVNFVLFEKIDLKTFLIMFLKSYLLFSVLNHWSSVPNVSSIPSLPDISFPQKFSFLFFFSFLRLWPSLYSIKWQVFRCWSYF